MIERPRHSIALPLSNPDRKRAYLLRLIASHHYDEHNHAWRVADGQAVMRRLHQHWKRKAREKAIAALPQRPLLTLESRRTA